MEAEQFISNAAAELEMVVAQLRDIEARATTLRSRAEGLRFIIQYGQEAHAASHPQGSAFGAASISAADGAPGAEEAQTDRVLKALTDIGRAAMTSEVTDRVNASGDPLSHEKVRSALGYLLRKRPPRVERVRPGVWRLPKAAPSPAAFKPTPLTLAANNGSRGES